MGQIESSFVDNFDIDVVRHESLSLEYLAHSILIGKIKKIIVVTGAGTSVSAGIPDFRSVTSGVYHNLQKYNLEEPEDIFSISHFRQRPGDFMDFVKNIFPRHVAPTITHFFIELLELHHMLVRHYTQNVDSLATNTTVFRNNLVELHGSFDTAHCLVCGKIYQKKEYERCVANGSVIRCNSRNCHGYVKPDIVFYGESINKNYIHQWQEDIQDCDAVFVIGTSLNVEPVSTFINSLPLRTLRVLINKEMIDPFQAHFDYSKMTNCYIPNYKNIRDIAYIGDCDEGVIELSKLLYWDQDLLQLVNNWIEDHPSFDCSHLQSKLKYLQMIIESSSNPIEDLFDI